MNSDKDIENFEAVGLGGLPSLLDDFQKVIVLAGVSFPFSAFEIETLLHPHKQPSALPSGKMAVYVFVWNGRCLKVGKVGPRSRARFTSQHYKPRSSKSNLAKSLVKGQGKLGLSGITESDVGAWIKANVDRVNFLLDAECGIPILTLLESFLQCRLSPVFEGFESQR